MKKPFFQSGMLIFVSIVFLIVFYSLTFLINKNSLVSSYETANSDVPSIELYSMSTADKVLNIGSKYGALGSIAIALVYLILLLVVGIIFKVTKITKLSFGIPLVVIVSSSLLLLLGMDMKLFTTGYTPIINGIKFFVGTPLFYSSLLVVIFGIISLFISMGKKPNIPTGIVLLILPFVLGGCFWETALMGASCPFTGDESGHCFQQIAVQSGDPAKCEKVTAPAEFQKLGSNPPRDKCLDMIAQNKNDAEICKQIKEGPGSYSQTGCVENVATSNNDIDACNALQNNMQNCVLKTSEPIVQDINEKLSDTKPLSKKEIQELQAQMEKISNVYEMLSQTSKNIHDNNMNMIKNLK